MNVISAFLLSCLIGSTAFGQPDKLSVDSIRTVTDTLPQSTLRKGRLAIVIATESTLYLGSMAYLQFVWYDGDKRVPFEFYNDSGGYLQVDKFGHAYGAYLESYLGYHALRWAGVPKRKALLYGATLGFVLQAPIEVWDGLYEGWGFSWGDIGANAFGTSLFLVQEQLFDEQRIKYKFSFAASTYAKQANGYLGTTSLGQVFNDYNGHTYWLSMSLNRIIKSPKIPAWLCVSVGYGANGMFGEFKNLSYYAGATIPETQRYRQFLLSLDVDWTKIKTRSRFLNGLFKSMFMLKLPFPAIEFNSKGQFKAYGLYY
ncbi:MAG: DUF2279 domain-containing protein [Cytophagaceae bacterium]|nr:MAG: DUF2279 domain-containing protein [Cytophagaceae bacterium]